jgi:putative oligomerization/nucleic acid binding protein
MKTIKNKLITLCFMHLLIITNTVFAASFFDDDEDIIWQGAPNNYFKYDDQDSSKYGKNDHPVELEEKEIIDALTALEYTEKNILNVESIVSVFSYSQVRLLAEYLSKGLDEAKPAQDIIFVIGGKRSKLIVLKTKIFLTGRAFYKDNKLNIIIGEFDFARNTAFEAVLDPGDTGEIAYSFSFGSRTGKSKGFKENINSITGVSQKEMKGKPRQDWFEIDVKLAAEAYLTNKKEKESPGLNQDRALKIEAAKLAKQRREMRAEMARMRKDMEQRNNSTPSSAKSIEERMTTLDKLLEKGLISQEEYEVKRKEILNDI